MKLQLKVFSGSWWATENRKQTQKPKGQAEGIVPCYKNNSLFSLTHNCCRDVKSVGFTVSDFFFFGSEIKLTKAST